MNHKIKMAQVIERFDENHIEYYTVDLDGGNTLIVSRFGGRVIGPFDRETGESLIWLSDAFSSRERFSELAGQGRIPIGAERLWIAPELNFYTTKRENFDIDYHCQQGIDPGTYSIVKTGNKVSLHMYADVKAYSLPFSSKQFEVRRQVLPAANPLRFLPNTDELMKGVYYTGYRQDVFIEDLSPEKAMYLEPWLVMQVNPPGEVIIPFTGSEGFAYDDYYDPVDGTFLEIRENYAVLQGTGARKYKLAFKSANTTGRSAYLTKLDNERYLLIIKSFYNDPSTPYCKEGWQAPGIRGCSLFIYNGFTRPDGVTGFVEFEHVGQTIGLDSGRDWSNSETCHWFFTGAKEALARIMDQLLGIKYR